MELRFIPAPPKKITVAPQKKLAALRERLVDERLANLKNPAYLCQRAAEYHGAGDKVAWLAYTLQAEAVAMYRV